MAAGLVPSADSPALLLTSESEAAALTAQQRRDLPGQPLLAGVYVGFYGETQQPLLLCILSCSHVPWRLLQPIIQAISLTGC
jgi:hypothetical protein